MADKFEPLVNSMEQGIKDMLGQLIDGTIQDLDGPIREISLRLSMAARRQRMDLAAACRDQLELIVMEKRLRLETDNDGVLGLVLSVGINSLINAAIGALASR